jgi:tetratricopeptide (TPR) repeat protein
MKRLLACFACIGLLLASAFSVTASAVTYEEARKLIAEKGSEVAAGKIKNEDFVDFCTRLLADACDDSQAKAFLLASRGGGYRNMGDTQKARQDTDASIAANDSIPAGYAELGNFFYVSNNFAEAADAYKKAASRAQSEEFKKALLSSADTAIKKAHEKNKQDFINKINELINNKSEDVSNDFIALGKEGLKTAGNDKEHEAIAHTGIAIGYQRQNKLVESIKEVDIALSLAPRRFMYFVKAYGLKDLGKAKEAFTVCADGSSLLKDTDMISVCRKEFPIPEDVVASKTQEKPAKKDVQKEDPCANIKTMEDWNKASLLWQMANNECNPRRKEERRKEEQAQQAQKDFEANIPAMTADMTKAIRSAVKKSKEFGDYELEVNVKKNSYSAVLTYPKDPLPMRAAEMISKAAVLAMIKVLLSQGKDPAQDWTGIHAHVYSRLKGVTGKAMVREYGMASYDFNADQVIWRR